MRAATLSTTSFGNPVHEKQMRRETGASAFKIN